jgi:hypothetical protein
MVYLLLSSWRMTQETPKIRLTEVSALIEFGRSCTPESRAISAQSWPGLNPNLSGGWYEKEVPEDAK